MEGSEFQISIVIPTKEREQVFGRTLRSVCGAIQAKSVEVIVVNDGQPFEPPRTPQGCPVRYIQNPRRGVSAARNLGARAARAPVLLFLDNDMIISGKNIDCVLGLDITVSRAYALNWIYPPQLSLELAKTQFGRFLGRSGWTTLKGWYNNPPAWNDTEVFEVDTVSAQALLIAREVFLEVGGFNEDIAEGEDSELSERLRARRVRLFVCPFCTVHHNEEDRVDIRPWLDRKIWHGQRLRRARDAGRSTAEIHYTPAKAVILRVGSYLKGQVILLLDTIAGIPCLDPMAFLLIELLLSVSIYEGYTRIISGPEE